MNRARCFFLFLAATLACSPPQKEKEKRPFLPSTPAAEPTIDDWLIQGEVDLALSSLEEKLHQGEAGPDLLRYGRALRLCGRLSEASAALDRAVIADPSLRESALREKLSIQLEQGTLAEAGKTLRELGPSDEEKPMLSFFESFEGEAYRVSGEPVVTLPLAGDGGVAIPQIECRVEGQSFIPLLLDTGATLCVFTKSLAKRLGQFTKVEGGVLLDLEGKPLAADYGIVGRIELGEIRVDNVPVLLVEDSALAPRLFGLHTVFRAQGALGMGVLRLFRTRFDFPRGRVEFSRVASDESKGLALRSTGLTLYATVEPSTLPVDARESSRRAGGMCFRIDTGSNQSAITPFALERWGWQSRAHPRVGYAAGAQGWSASLREVEVPGLRWGAFRWGPMRLPVAAVAEASNLEVGGALGMDLLRSLRLTIDARGMKATLETD